MSSTAGFVPMGGMRGGGPAGPSYGRAMAPSFGGAPTQPAYGASSSSSHQRAMPPQAMPPSQAPGPQGTLPPGTKIMVGQIVVTVQKYLSQGGFAHVYLVTTDKPIPVPVSATSVPGGTAVTTRGETLHVLKRMAVPDKEALAGVRSEVEIHKSIRAHPNIVHFVEASASALRGGGYEVFILMEYCSGGGIIDLMNARLRTRLTEAEVLKIFGDVAAGLHVMHSMDPPIMHRDLKVENILLAPPPKSNPGVGPTYKLCDFGSAKPLMSRKPARSLEEVKRLEADLNMHTTLQYRAPEMVDVYQRRTIDEKADIWAMGVLLYKLCYYTTPFEENGGGPLAILNARYRFPNMPPYSQRLKDLIASMLQEHSHMRPTIEEVMLSVHRILGTKPPASLLKSSHRDLGGSVLSQSDLSSPAPRLPRRNSHDMPNRQSSTADDLIAIGPSDADRRRAEEEERKRRAQDITPMRRGRPTKPMSTSPDKVETPSRLSASVAPRPPSASPTRVSKRSQDAPIDGFGDSFAPVTADTALSRPASVLKHSPSLPGFDTPSRASPVQGVSSSVAERSRAYNARAPLQPTNVTPIPDRASVPDDAATSRFPSVEELDKRFPTRKPDPPSSSMSSTKAAVAVPGLANRDPVSAMAGRFNGSAKANVPSSPSARQTASLAPNRPRVLSAASPDSAPQQPALPSRKQIHKDWLRKTPSGTSPASESIGSVNGAGVSNSQIDKIIDAGESSGSEEDGPEDPDATAAPRADTTGTASLTERQSTLTHRQSSSVDLDLMEKAPELRNKPGRVQPPSWLTQHASPSKPAASPPQARRETARLASIDVPAASASLDTTAATSNKQSASAPAWDEDDEEMHFLPQPTLGTSHEQAAPALSPAVTSNTTSASVPKPRPTGGSYLIDIGEPSADSVAYTTSRGAAPLMAPVKKYADASTSPHNASPTDDGVDSSSYTRAESEMAIHTAALPSSARPIIAPKPERSTSAKDIGKMVTQLESTSFSSATAPKKMPDVPKKPSTISNRLKAYETATNGVGSAAVPAAPVPTTSSVPASPEVVKRKPPLVAPKPATIRSSSGLKPWEREALEREQVQKYGILQANNRVSPETLPTEQQPGTASDLPPTEKQNGEAQERFRGVSSLISQWQNNASRGAPGWGTVGSQDSEHVDGASISSGRADDDNISKSPQQSHRASAHLSTDTNGLMRSGTLGRQRMVSREV